MTWLRVLVSRLKALFRKSRLDCELDEELRSHLEMYARLHLFGVESHSVALFGRKLTPDQNQRWNSWRRSIRKKAACSTYAPRPGSAASSPT